MNRLQTSLIALLAILPAQARAQTPVTDLEEIVVTARRRTERLQDVPISLTVLDGDALGAAGLQAAETGGHGVDVGAGAEVIADGNIHIYGTLRGKAIAGAAGDSSKRIYCYNLQAELVSIAGNYWLSESLQGEFWSKSACVKLQDDQLVLAELV